MRESTLIEYREITRFPTCLNNYRRRILNTGQILEMRNQVECKPGEQWSAEWQELKEIDSQHLSLLKSFLNKSNFFSLPERIEDKNIVTSDGFVSEIEVWLDGKHHKAVLINGHSDIFEKVRQYILQL